MYAPSGKSVLLGTILLFLIDQPVNQVANLNPP